MSKQFISFWILFLVLVVKVNGQIDKYNTVDLHPVSPTAFQFLKYTEMPVSEYTGIPNISIPLYEINVDEVKIPIQLTYHSQGIRISQEASWVGLGWDLGMGSIIQNINDRDDYNTDTFNVKRLPDYFPSMVDGAPTVLPMRFKEPSLENGVGWTNPYPINQPQAQQGFAIATKEYAPVNGQFEFQEDRMFGITGYDSEPDICEASFLGINLKFIVDFHNPNTLVVLNKKGYLVNKTSNGFSITTPSGSTYFFETKSIVQNLTWSENIDGISTSSQLGGDLICNIYFLSKILTKNGKVITFEYASTNQASEYPISSGKLQALTNPIVNNSYFPPLGYGWYQFANVDARAYGSFEGGGVHNTYSTNLEQYFYLKSITFPSGRVDFLTSDRTDIMGGKKLDQIQVTNSNAVLIKSWQLDYSYFDASGITGNGYGYNNNDVTLGSETRSSLRLKLSDVKDNSGGVYNLIYNTTPLPKKNSFATDYWGFYNGKLSNSSFVPNPVVLNLPSLGDNGNDKNANLIHAQAAILQSIQYPTGGKVTFDYELNEFDPVQMLGLPSGPSLIQGDGLRVSAITHFDSDQHQALKTVYSYEAGKLINSMQIRRDLDYSKLSQWTSDYIETVSYRLIELSTNEAFASTPLSSVNGVGYTKVTMQQVDVNNNATGKTVTEFYNNLDIHNSTISTSVPYYNIPSIKSITAPENGSVVSINVYDNQNQLLKTISNNYNVVASNIYYGARIMPYGHLFYYNQNDGSQVDIPQNIIGYYPIYDIETLLSGTTQTDYANGATLVTTVSNTYDQYNQLSHTEKSGSNSVVEAIDYAYPYNPPSGSTVFSDMVTKNRIADVVHTFKYNTAPSYKSLAAYDKIFSENGDKFLTSQENITEHIHPYNNKPTVITYDQYDLANGNLLQYTKLGITTSYVWGYDNTYPIAEVVNATRDKVAYTSFENDDFGDWSMNPGSTIVTGGLIGNNSFSGVIRKTVPPGTYIVTLWGYRYGSQTVNGQQGQALKTIGTWALKQWELTNPGTVEIAADNCDEVRLYPSGAQMTTYTYEPLMGMTSQCDINNRITYYDYDSFGRLLTVRDQDGNVLKKYCYNYTGQSGDCTASTAPNWRTASLSCEQTNGQNTGNQILVQRDMNPYSSSYFSTKSTTIYNTTVCPLPAPPMVYARLSYENAYTDYDGSVYGDIVVRFYSDQGCTQPVSVSNLTVSYNAYYEYNGSTYTYSDAANDNFIVLQYGTNLNEPDPNCDPGYYNQFCRMYNIDYYLNNGNGYMVE